MSTTRTESVSGDHVITVPQVRRGGVSKIVVLAWVIAALGVGFALGRLLPPGLLG